MKTTIYVCCDCGQYTEKPRESCICGCSCITKEQVKA